MTTNYALDFHGYWREPDFSGMPNSSGLYGVYAGSCDLYGKNLSLLRLLYIGEGDDIHDRIANHEKWGEWRRQLGSGELLYLNAALIPGQIDRQRAEAAMIFTHKPPCNTEYVYCFPFDTVTILTTGCNALMNSAATSYRTEDSKGDRGKT